MRGLAPCQQDLRMNAGTGHSTLGTYVYKARRHTPLTHARSFLIYFIVCRLVVLLGLDDVDDVRC